MSTATEPLDAAVFMAEHGRLPHLGVDPHPPWEYRGWLLPLVQWTEIALRGEASRWAYHLEIIETGRLPDRPIPKLPLTGQDGERLVTRAAVAKHLEHWSSLNGWDMGGWTDFGVLLDWFMWGLALTREQPRYHNSQAAEKLYRTVNVEHLLRCPYDHFGAWIGERKGAKWNPHAFFATPHEIVEFMVQVLIVDAAKEGVDTRSKTVCDPCVGTGRMLLHAAQYSLRLYGTDIDPVVLKCCLINGALYAPWLAYPLPDSLFETPAPPWPERAEGPVDDLVPVAVEAAAPDVTEGPLALPAPEPQSDPGESRVSPGRRARGGLKRKTDDHPLLF